MRVQLPMGAGKSLDAIVAEAFRKLECERWGGASVNGWSKQADFQRCPRRYQLMHELGAVPLIAGEVAPGLDVGSVGHLTLASHYAAMLPDDRYPGWRVNPPTPAVVLDTLEACGLDVGIAALCRQLFDGYLEAWANEDVRPLAVEMAAGDEKFHTSRFDMIFYTEDGTHDGLWIGEHKFLKSGTDIDEYRLNGEVLGEILAFHLSNLEEFFGMPLNGVCLNVIFKPTKTGLPRYQRLWIAPPWEAIQRYAADRKYWIQALLEAKRMRIWPRALHGCTSKYRPCRFFAHCRDLDDTVLRFPPK